MILTEEEIEAIPYPTWGDSSDYARAIEAAIISKIGEPVSAEFQAEDGTWHGFINEQHYKNTVEDGRWPIRTLYAIASVKGQ